MQKIAFYHILMNKIQNVSFGISEHDLNHFFLRLHIETFNQNEFFLVVLLKPWISNLSPHTKNKKHDGNINVPS